MKNLVYADMWRKWTLVLLIPGFLAVHTFSLFAVTVDVYQDMESGTDGSTLTAAIAGNGSHGSGGSWSITGSNLKVRTAGEHPLRGPVTVAGGSTYSDIGSTRGWGWNDNVNLQYAAFTTSNSHSAFVISCFLTVGPSPGLNELYDAIQPGAGLTYAIVQIENNGTGNLALWIEAYKSGTVHSPTIHVTSGTTYWVSFKADAAAGLASLDVYEIVNWTQIGSVTRTMTTGTMNLIRFGRTDSHGDTSATTSYIDDICISWTDTTFPFVPAAASNQPPVAVATATPPSGVSPLTVAFSSGGSFDPSGSMLTYNWTFGDGSPGTNSANPLHTFSAPAGVTTNFGVTLTVTNSIGLSAQTNLIVWVNETPPTITGIGNQIIDEDTTTGPLAFTVGDGATAASNLVLSASSSNTNLVTTNSILFGGNGTNRTITVSPATNQNGSATITVSVSDGLDSASTNFVLTVNAVNDPPTISKITDQTISVNGTTGPLSFTVGDVDTPTSNLTLSANSSNLTLVPTNNIVFGGSGTNRTVTVTPAANQSESSTIVVTVSDGALTANDTFVVTVAPLITNSFTNGATITIPSYGLATPYPSAINISGVTGTIASVTATLKNLSHTWKADLNILLVSPGGQNVMIMSHAGDVYTASGSVTLTFSDAAAAYLPATNAISSGTYKPTDYPPTPTMPAPAPAGPWATNMSAFNGQSANGTWSLYVVDDGVGDSGSIASGWSIKITTTVGTRQTPVITWTNPAAITYGTVLGGTQLNATASVPGTFVYNPVAGTVLNASNSQVLSARFTPTDTQNYTSVTNTVLIDVQKAPLTVTANSFVKSYGETVTFAGTEFTSSGLVNGDTVTNVTLTSIGNKGTAGVGDSPYSIVASAAQGSSLINYSITYLDGTLTVQPKGVDVTANDESKTYGDTVTFAGTEFSAIGIINGDGVTNVTLTSLGAGATATVVDSPYSIEPSAAVGNGLGNYTISYKIGTLTVNKEALLVAGNNASRAYGATNPVFSVSYTGFVNGEDTNALGGAVVITTPAVTNSAPGSYPIIPGGLTSTNYAITFTNGTLTVTAVNTPPTLAAVSNHVLNAGQVLSFTSVGSDTDAPPQALTFSLLNSPAGATLNATNGVFMWRPATAQADTTNLIKFMVADNGVPVMSATQSFTVTVNTLARPSLTPLELTNNQFAFFVTGDAGPDYTVQGSPDLEFWTNLFTANSPALPFTWTFTNTADFSQQFFRVLLGP